MTRRRLGQSTGRSQYKEEYCKQEISERNTVAQVWDYRYRIFSIRVTLGMIGSVVDSLHRACTGCTHILL
jgi:hypothetical protein